MVTYAGDDVIALEDFSYAWRFLEAKYTDMSVEAVRDLVPLSAERSKQVCALGAGIRNSGSPYVNTARFSAVREHRLAREDEASDADYEWFSAIPIAPNERVYVSWRNDVTLVTSWESFIAHWEDTWYPFDTVDVFDETMRWAVLIGPEECAVYAEAVEPGSPEGDPGFCLVRTSASS